MVQWLGLHTPKAGDIPGQGSKSHILHGVWKKKPKYPKSKRKLLPYIGGEKQNLCHFTTNFYLQHKNNCPSDMLLSKSWFVFFLGGPVVKLF